MPSCDAFGKEYAERFCAEADPIVMKSLGYPIVPQPDQPDKRTAIITTAVVPSNIASAPEDAFTNNPIFFQGRVVSGAEWRVMHSAIGRFATGMKTR